jgi:hypothetical protein
MWPGITWGYCASCCCTWAPRSGTYQVKLRDTMCTIHAAAARGRMFLASHEIGRRVSVTWSAPLPLPRGAAA